jgi:hypothetical protein
MAHIFPRFTVCDLAFDGDDFYYTLCPTYPPYDGAVKRVRCTHAP